jgi:hypothetical protein
MTYREFGITGPLERARSTTKRRPEAPLLPLETAAQAGDTTCRRLWRIATAAANEIGMSLT